MTLIYIFNVAGTLVNNVAFLSALPCSVCCWVRVACCCPSNSCPSLVSALCLNGDLLGGLYLLFSTAAFASFDQQQYAFVALWGAIATATVHRNGAHPLQLWRRERVDQRSPTLRV